VKVVSFLYSGIPVRVVTRPGSQLLGINGRDDGPLVSYSYSVPLVESRCRKKEIDFCLCYTFGDVF
jgi:hypothetical protein